MTAPDVPTAMTLEQAVVAWADARLASARALGTPPRIGEYHKADDRLMDFASRLAAGEAVERDPTAELVELLQESREALTSRFERNRPAPDSLLGRIDAALARHRGEL